MIDFSKLGKAKGQSKAATFGELFDQLDRKATHNSLRPVQIEALATLDKHVNERDVVLKVSTGSGKTLVGLIYAEYMRRRYPDEPVLYLCPTKQLADQVLDSATAIGVEAETFETDSSGARGLQGKAVLVCTYDKLFNARNIFAKRDIQPSTIVLDDVHAGVDRVRQKYTVRIPAEIYPRIRDIFRPLCETSDPAIWRGIVKDEPDAKYEVPYWVWIPQSKMVAELLEPLKEKDSLCFEWNNLARYLDYARLCVTGTSAELSLPIAAVEENPAFNAAKHRLFMSASIKDGSPLVRDLALDPAALSRIVQPPSDRGAGERMILPVSLIDPKIPKAAIAQLCGELSKTKNVNVVVLTSSAKQADTWTKAGAIRKQGTEVDEEIAVLRSGKRGRYAVFAQRFDGVDLPDDACRVLVIDGTPAGERLCDQIDSERQKNSPGYNSRTVNRFEQALGRAVRSSADYAAILLAGADIASFIGRKDVKDVLEAHTRAQIELGIALAEDLANDQGDTTAAIRSAIHALISRDNGWKEAHRERVAAAGNSMRTGTALTLGERAAVAERDAWQQAKARNHQGAADTIQQIVNDKTLHPYQRAELIVRASGYLYRVDTARAATFYQTAFQANSSLPRPAEMPDKKYGRIRAQSANMHEYLQSFVSANAAVAKLEEIRATLAYSGDADTVENGLQQLGEMLGAMSSRPEKETGRGPDVLWLFDSVGLCIEAKSEKETLIRKKDAQQLTLSLTWCEAHTDLDSDALVPVFATNVTTPDRPEDLSFGPSFLSEALVMDIIERLRKVLTALSYDGRLFNQPDQINEGLRQAKLRGEDIVASLGKPKGKSKK
jgi:hypothetical protein